jgi:predicted transcriptional regulator
MVHVLRWLRGRGRLSLGAWFGQLELRVLDSLWRRGQPSAVRDLRGDFPGAAYTTVMTTLDRLHRKGVLERVKSGRAFLYSPRFSREQLQAALAEDALRGILGPDAARLRPVLSMLVDAVSRQDREVLDELERLAGQRRSEHEAGQDPPGGSGDAPRGAGRRGRKS